MSQNNMFMFSKLKRCPFCGANPKSWAGWRGTERTVFVSGLSSKPFNVPGKLQIFYVQCSECNIKTEEYKSRNWAHRKWNKRI